MNAVLDDVLTDLQFKIDETDSEITREDLPTVDGDERQLQQLFQNLLGNAIEYSGDEPPRIHVSAAREMASGGRFRFATRASASMPTIPTEFSSSSSAVTRPKNKPVRESGWRCANGSSSATAGDWGRLGVRNGSTFFFTLPTAVGPTLPTAVGCRRAIGEIERAGRAITIRRSDRSDQRISSSHTERSGPHHRSTRVISYPPRVRLSARRSS